MDDKLNTLIAYYEEEKGRLLLLIEKYVKEEEYQLAHFHSEALYQLNRRLQTLKNIDDKLYDQKHFRQIRITNLEKQLESESSDYMREYLTKDFLKQKEDLNKLNQHPKQNNTFGNETILDETLINLVGKKIKSFKLILKKVDNLILEFTYYNKALKVTLPFVKRHIKKWTLYDDNINSFKKLGFDLTDNESKLVFTLTGNKEIVVDKLKIILSKIVFEIFYFKEFDNESYLQIREKASR